MSIKKTLEFLVLELMYPIVRKNGTLCLLFKWEVPEISKTLRDKFYSCYWNYSSWQGLINVLWKFCSSSFLHDCTVSISYALKTQAWESWNYYCYYFTLLFQVCCPAQTDWNAYLSFHETIVSQELAFQNI